MKRTLVIAALILLLAGGAWAQLADYDLGQFQDSFTSFANAVANSLPATASIGTWSPAYIGQFPHFGVGLTVGGAFIPYSTMEETLSMLSVSLPPQVAFMKKWGLPFPAWAIDGRIGGFFFPFDLGVRVGFIPQCARQMLGSVNVDYLLVGGDIRFPILKDKGWVPALSVGAGYTYMRGAVGMPDALGAGDTTVDLSDLMGAGYWLKATDPDLTFSWRTSTITAKVQVSKNLLIFTPHLGLGAAYGISKAGGGMESSIYYSTDSGVTYDRITDAQIAAIKQAFEDAGYVAPDISADGFLINAKANGFSFWLYGGTAINIFFIKLDLSAMYNLLTSSWGASVNLRFQL
jgi:hypothetical protein